MTLFFVCNKSLGLLSSFAQAQEDFEDACEENDRICKEISESAPRTIGSAIAEVGRRLRVAADEVMGSETRNQ